MKKAPTVRLVRGVLPASQASHEALPRAFHEGFNRVPPRDSLCPRHALAPEVGHAARRSPNLELYVLKFTTLAVLSLVGALAVRAQGSVVSLPMPPARNPVKLAPSRTTPAITDNDLMSRLYAYADDSMGGREFATPGNTRATAWIAEQLKKIGLVPAGENGTYFQTLPVMDRSLDETRVIATDAGPLRWWADLLPRDQGDGARSIDGVPVIFAGTWGDANMISDAQAAGKLVVVRNSTAQSAGTNIPGATINRGLVSARFKSAAGILVPTLDLIPAELREQLKAGATILKSPDVRPAPTFLYATAAVGLQLLGAPVETLQPGASGKRVHGTVVYAEKPIDAPARNVVGIIPGSNPALRGQYVAVGAHNDHIGTHGPAVDHDSAYLFLHMFQPLGADMEAPKLTSEQAARLRFAIDSVRKLRPARLDSIYNGADDDGTGTVAVLELAEAIAAAKVKPQRSMLFVWHTGEEAGLFGSAYYTDNPTVPRDSIVAQINIDMIGRGDAWDLKEGKSGYLQVIGSRRLSTELGALVDQVNIEKKHGLAFDYQFDANGHPQQYYCRSDHYMYARYGIPVAFFSTGGHPDYHQLTDEPQYIDYQHMAQVVNYVYDLLYAVANLDHRIVVDKTKPDPNGRCVQ